MWADDKYIQKLANLQPDLFQKFVDFEQAVYRPGKLSTKFKELIAVGVTHVIQCDLYIAYHTRKAQAAGATEEEMSGKAAVSDILQLSITSAL